jgi:RNAse (barnase) inhibitor barstar
MTILRIDTSHITDWNSFHDVFAEAFSFPDFYGRNMNAWIDCLTDFDGSMTSISLPPGGVLTFQLDDVDGFAARCPEQYAAVVECAAFVNWRRVQCGEPSVLALSFHRHA